jgi:hypothetical protein
MSSKSGSLAWKRLTKIALWLQSRYSKEEARVYGVLSSDPLRVHASRGAECPTHRALDRG